MMDALTSTRKPKKKSYKGKGEDRISSLPDNIVQEILSFLPTRQAVSTCVLSKRWKYLWTGISTLDFCYRYEKITRPYNRNYQSMKFMNFVANVLLLQDAIVINKFRFSCIDAVTLDMSKLNAWISTVLSRQVRVLIIEIGLEDHPIVIPFLHLNCESLKIKCLDGDDYVLVCLSMSPTLFECELLKTSCIESIPKDPASMSLSRLKVLHLTNTKISFDQESQQVSFSFPVLEEALLKNFVCVDVTAVIFFAPALKKLILADDDKDHYLGIDSFKIKVYAESLMFLDFSFTLSYDLSLHNLSSLYKASLDTYLLDTTNETENVERRLSKIFEAMSNVRDLAVSVYIIKAIYDGSLKLNLLAFPNLKTLRVYVQWAYDNYLDGYTLKKFFCYLANIEALFFSTGLGDAEDSRPSERYGWTIETTTQPLLSNLKSVEINNSNGHENELGMVEFLLRNARALQKITITSSSKLRSDREKQFNYAKELLLLPRGSTCVIDIS